MSDPKYKALPTTDGTEEGFHDSEIEAADAELEACRKWVDEVFVKGTTFQTLIAVIILANAAVIGLETDLPKKEWLWDIFENTFLAIFVFELIVRLYVLRGNFFMGQELTSNIFDFVLVVLGAVEFLCTHVIHMSLGQFGMVIKAARLLRIMRLFRLFKMIKQLYVLASGFLESSVAVFWVSVLCGLILYICAIFLTRTLGQLGKGDDATGDGPDKSMAAFYQDHFGTVLLSMFTLFELMSNPDLEQLETLLFSSPGMMLFFIVFIIYGSFAMLSILTGVISEGMIEKGNSHKEEMRFEEERRKNKFLGQLREHFEASDADGDGTMTRTEFTDKLPELIKMFKEHGFEYSRDDLEMVFDLVDFDKGGTVEVEEFLQGMTSFSANVSDLPLQFLRLQSNLFLATKKLQESVEGRISNVHRSLTTLDNKLTVATKRDVGSSNSTGSGVAAKKPGACC